MIGYWNTLSAREQILIGTAGAVIALMAMIFLVITPLQSARERAVDRLEAAQALYTEMTQGAAEADRLRQNARPTRAGQPRELRTVLIETARASDVTITRLEPLDNGGQAIWLDEVNSQALHAWLAELYLDHGLAVNKVSLRPDAQGRIRAQLDFAQGGGA